MHRFRAALHYTTGEGYPYASHCADSERMW